METKLEKDKLSAVQSIKAKITMADIADHEARAKQLLQQKLEERGSKRLDIIKKHNEEIAVDRVKLKELRTKFNDLTEEELVKIAKLREMQKTERLMLVEKQKKYAELVLKEHAPKQSEEQKFDVDKAPKQSNWARFAGHIDPSYNDSRN